MAEFITPQQARSREALSRILDAAETLLLEKHFDDLSIVEIAEKANISVGNFYARFKHKSALLAVLHERYEQSRTQKLTAVMKSVEGKGLKARINAVLTALVDLMSSHRGVLKSIITTHWQRPEGMSDITESRLDALYKGFAKLLLECKQEISHPQPAYAVKLATQNAVAACRERLVLRPAAMPGSVHGSDRKFVRELSNMLYAYLASRPGEPS